MAIVELAYFGKRIDLTVAAEIFWKDSVSVQVQLSRRETFLKGQNNISGFMRLVANFTATGVVDKNTIG